MQAAIKPDRRYTTIEAIEDKQLVLCMSPELMGEIKDLLTRPLLASKFPALVPLRVTQFLENVGILAVSFTGVPSAFTWPQHPDDDHVFNLAIYAKAKYLVTWETRILKLGIDTTPPANLLRQLAPNLSIVTPKQLADWLKNQGTVIFPP